MSAEATGWTWKHSPYRGAELLVHLAIADVVNDVNGNEFWMSTANLAEKAKVSRSTVTATLRDLVAEGLLEVLEAGGQQRRPTRYRFLFASAESGPASALSDSTRPESARNTKEPNEQPNGASALTALKADPECPRCLGAGMVYSGAGFDRPCSCCDPRPLVPIEGAES